LIRHLIATLCLVAAANTNAYSGNDLLNDLTSTKRYGVTPGNALHDGVGMGYIMGASDMLIQSEAVCYPKNIKNGQISTAVQKYLEGNPEKRDAQAALLVYIALTVNFPCKK